MNCCFEGIYQRETHKASNDLPKKLKEIKKTLERKQSTILEEFWSMLWRDKPKLEKGRSYLDCRSDNHSQEAPTDQVSSIVLLTQTFCFYFQFFSCKNFMFGLLYSFINKICRFLLFTCYLYSCFIYFYLDI